jgi:hypothetical protein
MTRERRCLIYFGMAYEFFYPRCFIVLPLKSSFRGRSARSLSPIPSRPATADGHDHPPQDSSRLIHTLNPENSVAVPSVRIAAYIGEALAALGFDEPESFIRYVPTLSMWSL